MVYTCPYHFLMNVEVFYVRLQVEKTSFTSKTHSNMCVCVPINPQKTSFYFVCALMRENLYSEMLAYIVFLGTHTHTTHMKETTPHLKKRSCQRLMVL